MTPPESRWKAGVDAAGFYALVVFWLSLAFSPALVEISSVVVIAAWLVLAVAQRRVGFDLNGALAVPLAIFVLLCLGSYFGSDYPAQSLRGIFKLLQQVSIFLLVIRFFKGAGRLVLFERLFLISFIIIVLDCVFQYGLGRDFIRGFPAESSGAGVRVSGSFKTYGKLGCFLIGVLPYLAALVVQKIRGLEPGKTRKFLYGMVIILGAALLYLTRSRGAMLAFVLGLFGVLIAARQYKKMLGLLLGFLVLLALMPRSMLIHLDADLKEQSLVERYYLWDRAANVIKAKPWTGTGINTYRAAHGRYDTTRNWRVRGYYAHNGYLQMAAETGLPSLLLFLVFLFQYFRLSLRPPAADSEPDLNRFKRCGLLFGVANILIFALVDTVIHNPQPVMTLWFLMGLQWAYFNHARQS